MGIGKQASIGSLIRFWSLKGYASYSDATRLQLELVDQRARDEIPDTVLFLEHKPVVTQGRGLQFTGKPRPRHMPKPAFLPAGTEFAESERGGDLTWHGPGQLVIYPIVKLDGKGVAPHHDVAGFLRGLEQALIRAIDAAVLGADRGGSNMSADGGAFSNAAGEVSGRPFGKGAGAKADATGVWVGDRKVASIGIAVRKWVTYHGVALNCVNDLAAFSTFSPCGFAPEVMTRLKDVLPAGALGADWRPVWERAFARAWAGFTGEIEERSGTDPL